MNRVMETMGLDKDRFNVDELRARVTVQEVMTDEEQQIQQSLNSMGEAPEDKTTKYIVTFTARKTDSDNPGDFARRLLDNMISIYLQDYGKNHVYSMSSPNVLNGLTERNYDYLEMVEIVDDSLNSTLTDIYNMFDASSSFRSSRTGYSYIDLYQEFERLIKTELSNTYAYILNNRVTKDKDVLVSKYQDRIQNYIIDNSARETELTAINNVIDSYVTMMRESGNTAITSDYILNNVYGTWNEEAYQYDDQTVQYDVLMRDYLNNRENFDWTLIDIAYCKYILSIYAGETGINTTITLDEFKDRSAADAKDGNARTGKAKAESKETESATLFEAGTVSNEEAGIITTQMLEDLIARTDHLYEILAETNEEFHELSGAANVNVLSNVIVYENQKVKVYAAIVVVIFLAILCVIVVVAGRFGDIVNYYAYRHKEYDIPNKSGCEKYIHSYENQLLPEDFGCFVLQLTGMQDKTMTYGLSAAEEMAVAFTGILKDVFPSEKDCFIGTNEPGQFVIFLPGTPADLMKVYSQTLKRAVKEYNFEAECKIEYEAGSANSEGDGVYRLKRLFVHALNQMKPAHVVDVVTE